MIVIDNFIQDEDLLNRIQDDEFFWKPGYNWYNGWWEVGINNIRHELIHAIWGPDSPHPSIQTGGFEHWIGDYNETNVHEMCGLEWSLKLHFDKDEDKWHESKQIVGPKIGTVFYPAREIDEMEGGELWFWEKFPPERANDDGTIFLPPEQAEIIKPKFNRLIIFDAKCLHGVAKITKGRRRAIAINLWDSPPTEFLKDY
jgi:hypothetical protein